MKNKIEAFVEGLELLGFSVEQNNFACSGEDEVSIEHVTEELEPFKTSEWMMIFSTGLFFGLSISIKDIDTFNNLVIIKLSLVQ